MKHTVEWLGYTLSLNLDPFTLLYITIHFQSSPPHTPFLTFSLPLRFQPRVVNVIIGLWGLEMTDL